MSGHIAQDCAQGSDAKGGVAGDGDVMLAAFPCGEADVASRLAGDFISDFG